MKRIARFTADPFVGYFELPGSQHPYVYCCNNPVNYIDPWGLGWRYVGSYEDENGILTFVYERTPNPLVVEWQENWDRFWSPEHGGSLTWGDIPPEPAPEPPDATSVGSSDLGINKDENTENKANPDIYISYIVQISIGYIETISSKSYLLLGVGVGWPPYFNISRMFGKGPLYVGGHIYAQAGSAYGGTVGWSLRGHTWYYEYGAYLPAGIDVGYFYIWRIR